MEEENEQMSVKQVAIKWGLINGIISIVLFLTFYLGSLMGESWIGFIGPLFLAIIMYFAHKEFKEQGNSFMSYGQGLGIGTLTATVSGFVSTIFTYVYTKFIDTGYVESMLDMTRAKMEEQGQGEDQIEAAMGVVEKFMTPEIAFGIGILTAVFVGFIISLIVSAITKNNDPSLEV